VTEAVSFDLDLDRGARFVTLRLSKGASAAWIA